jgi:hypothetical protein
MNYATRMVAVETRLWTSQMSWHNIFVAPMRVAEVSSGSTGRKICPSAGIASEHTLDFLMSLGQRRA